MDKKFTVYSKSKTIDLQESQESSVTESPASTSSSVESGSKITLEKHNKKRKKAKTDLHAYNGSKNLWKNLSNMFAKSSDISEPASVKLLKDKDKGSTLRRLSSFFKHPKTSGDAIKPITKIGVSPVGYEVAVSQTNVQADEEKEVAMAVKLPSGTNTENVAVTIELEATKKDDEPVSDASSDEAMAMKCCEETDSKTVFTGTIRVPPFTDISKLANMPLYILDSKEKIVLNPGTEVAYRKLIRPSEDILLSDDEECPMLAGNIRIKIKLDKAGELGKDEKLKTKYATKKGSVENELMINIMTNKEPAVTNEKIDEESEYEKKPVGIENLSDELTVFSFKGSGELSTITEINNVPGEVPDQAVEMRSTVSDIESIRNKSVAYAFGKNEEKPTDVEVRSVLSSSRSTVAGIRNILNESTAHAPEKNEESSTISENRKFAGVSLDQADVKGEKTSRTSDIKKILQESIAQALGKRKEDLTALEIRSILNESAEYMAKDGDSRSTVADIRNILNEAADTLKKIEESSAITEIGNISKRTEKVERSSTVSDLKKVLNESIAYAFEKYDQRAAAEIGSFLNESANYTSESGESRSTLKDIRNILNESVGYALAKLEEIRSILNDSVKTDDSRATITEIRGSLQESADYKFGENEEIIARDDIYYDIEEGRESSTGYNENKKFTKQFKIEDERYHQSHAVVENVPKWLKARCEFTPSTRKTGIDCSTQYSTSCFMLDREIGIQRSLTFTGYEIFNEKYRQRGATTDSSQSFLALPPTNLTNKICQASISYESSETVMPKSTTSTTTDYSSTMVSDFSAYYNSSYNLKVPSNSPSSSTHIQGNGHKNIKGVRNVLDLSLNNKDVNKITLHYKKPEKSHAPVSCMNSNEKSTNPQQQTDELVPALDAVDKSAQSSLRFGDFSSPEDELCSTDIDLKSEQSPKVEQNFDSNLEQNLNFDSNLEQDVNFELPAPVQKDKTWDLLEGVRIKLETYLLKTDQSGKIDKTTSQNSIDLCRMLPNDRNSDKPHDNNFVELRNVNVSYNNPFNTHQYNNEDINKRCFEDDDEYYEIKRKDVRRYFQVENHDLSVAPEQTKKNFDFYLSGDNLDKEINSNSSVFQVCPLPLLIDNKPQVKSLKSLAKLKLKEMCTVTSQGPQKIQTTTLPCTTTIINYDLSSKINVSSTLQNELNALQLLYNNMCSSMKFLFELDESTSSLSKRIDSQPTFKSGTIETISDDLTYNFDELKTCLSTINEILTKSTESLQSISLTLPSVWELFPGASNMPYDYSSSPKTNHTMQVQPPTSYKINNLLTPILEPSPNVSNSACGYFPKANEIEHRKSTSSFENLNSIMPTNLELFPSLCDVLCDYSSRSSQTKQALSTSSLKNIDIVMPQTRAPTSDVQIVPPTSDVPCDFPPKASENTIKKELNISSSERNETYYAMTSEIEHTIEELLKESQYIKEAVILSGIAESEPPFSIEYVNLLSEPDPLIICKKILEDIVNSSVGLEETSKASNDGSNKVQEDIDYILDVLLEEVGKNENLGNPELVKVNESKKALEVVHFLYDTSYNDPKENCKDLQIGDANNEPSSSKFDHAKNDRFSCFCSTSLCTPKIPKTSFSFGESPSSCMEIPHSGCKTSVRRRDGLTVPGAENLTRDLETSRLFNELCNLQTDMSDCEKYPNELINLRCNMSDCEKCPNELINLQSNMSDCEKCPNELINLQSDMSNCEKCPNELINLQFDMSDLQSNMGDCEKCPNELINSQSDVSDYEKCPNELINLQFNMGYLQSNVSDCEKCNNELINLQSDMSDCEKYPNQRINLQSNMSDCEKCPNAVINLLSHMSDLQSNMSDCEKCSNELIRFQTNISDCEKCPDKIIRLRSNMSDYEKYLNELINMQSDISDNEKCPKKLINWQSNITNCNKCTSELIKLQSNMSDCGTCPNEIINLQSDTSDYEKHLNELIKNLQSDMSDNEKCPNELDNSETNVSLEDEYSSAQDIRNEFQEDATVANVLENSIPNDDENLQIQEVSSYKPTHILEKVPNKNSVTTSLAENDNNSDNAENSDSENNTPNHSQKNDDKSVRQNTAIQDSNYNISKSKKCFHLPNVVDKDDSKNQPSTSKKVLKSTNTTEEEEEIMHNIDLTQNQYDSSTDPEYFIPENVSGITHKSSGFHSLAQASCVHESSSEEEIVNITTRRPRSKKKKDVKKNDEKIEVIKPKTSIVSDSDSEQLTKTKQPMIYSDQGLMPLNSHIVLKPAKATRNLPERMKNSHTEGLPSNTSAASYPENSDMVPRNIKESEGSPGNEVDASDTEYEGDHESVQMNLPNPKHRYKSKQELNTPDEIAKIEQNVKENDKLQRSTRVVLIASDTSTLLQYEDSSIDSENFSRSALSLNTLSGQREEIKVIDIDSAREVSTPTPLIPRKEEHSKSRSTI